MSKLAHICFTLIIYKQFNFCRFRASAYTKVDRLCAVFLYNLTLVLTYFSFIYGQKPYKTVWYGHGQYNCKRFNSLTARHPLAIYSPTQSRKLIYLRLWSNRKSRSLKRLSYTKALFYTYETYHHGSTIKVLQIFCRRHVSDKSAGAVRIPPIKRILLIAAFAGGPPVR